MTGYVCGECRLPIVGEDPHTAPDGEDVHPDCCAVCADDPGPGADD